MKINFDENLRVAGIGVSPWPRLGPENWLKNYAIASYYGWSIAGQPGAPKNYALSDEAVPRPETLNTQTLFNTKEFCELLNRELPGYDLLVYRPISVIPSSLADRKILMVDSSFSEKYENKVNFRAIFQHEVDFPNFAIYDRAELVADPASYGKVAGPGDQALVIQDEYLSGGKGTFVVGNRDDYNRALANLNLVSKHSRVVVSERIDGARERSIQVCVTELGILTGPLQRQIIANPLLANPKVAGGDKFCGGVVVASDQNSDVHRAAIKIAEEIGQKLYNDGYRGIFGIDFLLDRQNKLYTIEVNPRLTGMTPLLTALSFGTENTPFYLLHILELGRYPYSLASSTESDSWADGSLLILHSDQDRTVHIERTLTGGTYKLFDGALVKVSKNTRLNNLTAGEFIVLESTPQGMRVKPGGRLATMLFASCVVNKITDELTEETSAIIKAVRGSISAK